jgi:isopentenyl phosphate kinase
MAVRDIVMVKLGGSLITDKRRPETAWRKTIERLADEIVEGSRTIRARVIVGHGGGSFGHVAAERHGLNRGRLRRHQLPGVSLTQDRAAVLHRMVISAFQDAGGLPWSVAPSSLLTATAGRPGALRLEPFTRALDLGLLPVTYGDVVLDREWGACICSTETVFLALARRLARAGTIIRRIVWLGETEGVYDVHGVPLPRVPRSRIRSLLSEVRGAAGTDVTGGMAHRLRTAEAFARMGIESWIADGRQTGLALAALRGRNVPGTRVVADK